MDREIMNLCGIEVFFGHLQKLLIEEKYCAFIYKAGKCRFQVELSLR